MKRNAPAPADTTLLEPLTDAELLATNGGAPAIEPHDLNRHSPGHTPFEPITFEP